MHRVLLFTGMGLSLLASGGCSPGPSLPLAIAAARNAADTVRTLLFDHHDPDQRDGGGLTPLMWAARHGAVDAMRALLDAGADPAARDEQRDNTPLGWAETALETTRNPSCAEVADYLRGRT